MKFNIAIISAILGTAMAAPAAEANGGLEARQEESAYVPTVELTFFGAADAQYTFTAPTNGQPFSINNPLSVSKISAGGSVTCYIRGSEGSDTTVTRFGTSDVGPPQPQVSGTCYYWY